MHERGTGLKELQKWMRHGKMEMTADVYLHVSKEREDKLADSLQDMFSAAPASQDMISHRKFGA
jgi:integrase